MSLWCWSSPDAVHAACLPSGCVHTQSKPLYVYLGGEQRASSTGPVCLGLHPWSVPPAPRSLLAPSSKKRGRSTVAVPVTLLAPWPPPNLSNEWAAGDMSCFVTLWTPFSMLGLEPLSAGKPVSRSRHFTHPEACSAGNRPLPQALVLAVGKGPQGSGRRAPGPWCGRWWVTSLGAVCSCL